MNAALGTLGLATGIGSAVPQALLGAAIASTVLCLESHRVTGVRIRDVGVNKCIRSCASVLCRCAPEVLGLCVVLMLAFFLRLRGDTEVMPDPMSQRVWEEIKVEWPILMGADTLLNLQAMLRLLLLCFVSIRAEVSGRSPLTGLAALLLMAGALCRAQLNTQSLAYRLEGPLALGGDLPAFCELAGLPFWAALGLRALKKTPVKATVAVTGALWFASHHYLNLAKDAGVDRLFIQAHVLELFAAFAYVARSFSLMVDGESADEPISEGGRRLVETPKVKGTAFVGFMHMLLVLQQALSAYYFLTAFEPHHSLVGGGRPFCVLIWANLLQLGAYICAAALFAGGCVDVDVQPIPAQLEAPPTITEVLQDDESQSADTLPCCTTEVEGDCMDDNTEVDA